MQQPAPSSPPSEQAGLRPHATSPTPSQACSSSAGTAESSSVESDRRSSEPPDRDQEEDPEEDGEDAEMDQDDEDGHQEDDEDEQGGQEEDGENDSDEDDDDEEEEEEEEGEQEEEEEQEGVQGSQSATTAPPTQTTNPNSPPPPPTSQTTSNRATSPSLSAKNRPSIDHSATLDLDHSSSLLTPNSYQQQVLERFRRVTRPRTFNKPPLIDPIVFIPHAGPIHALSLPPCGSHLFSGGQDGFIRRVSIYDSVTGSSLENLTMKQGGHVPLVEKDTDKSTIFLTGYWENEDYSTPQQPGSNGHRAHVGNQTQPEEITQRSTPLKWGPKSVGNATLVSPVYSLAIQNEELWGLSGTKGWDLNTGQVVNKFIAHASQISSVSLRQANGISIYDSKFEENWMERRREEEAEEEERDREGRVAQSERKVDRSEQGIDEQLDKDNKNTTTSDAMVVDDDGEGGAAKGKASEEGAPQEQRGTKVPSSSPDKPLAASDKNEGDDSDEDGSLFGGVDNSESEIEDSPDASIPLALAASPESSKASTAARGGLPKGLLANQTNEKKSPEKPFVPPLILPTAAVIKPRLPLQARKTELPSKNFTSVPSVLDASLPFLNDDVLMTSGIDGQVYLWDRRVGSNESSGGGFVRKLDVPKGTSPWTASASWSVDGRSIYVGRRNNSVDVYDLRFVKSSGANPKFNALQDQHFQTSVKLPTSSGPVSCVKPWPDGRHLLCASFDNLRLFNLNHSLDPSTTSRSSSKPPFKIIAGHSSGVVSQMCVTPSCRYLVTASGDRGWQNISNDLVVIHEIRNPPT